MTVDISRGSPLSWSFWSLVGRGRIKVARYAQSVYLRSQFLADEPIRIHDPATINKLHDAIEWDGVISSDWTTPDTYSQLSSKAGAYGEGTHARRASFRSGPGQDRVRILYSPSYTTKLHY